MRTLYTLSVCLYALAVRIWALKNQKARMWVDGRKESFGKLQAAFETNEQPVIWFHAASLGEFEQGRPVLEKFKSQNPDWKILLTFFSPSGYEIQKNYPLADCVAYLPKDTPKNAKKLMQIVNPQVVIFIKYEFWYNYLNELKKQNARVFFISVIFRPAQYFFKKAGGWFRKQLRGVEYFFVQNSESKELLNAVGFENVMVSGDTRFDRVSEILNHKKSFPIIESFKGNKKLLVVGSSWPDDEKMIAQTASKISNFKFLFVPHEIDEAHLQNLETLLQPSVLRYSKADENSAAEVQSLIVDRIGILSQLYQYADVAYIGGGFQKSGIHNILEAAAFGMPVLFGPNHQKFQEAQDLLALGGARSISQAADLAPLLNAAELQNSQYLSASSVSRDYVSRNKGATDLILKKIGNDASSHSGKVCKKPSFVLRFFWVLFGVLFFSFATPFSSFAQFRVSGSDRQGNHQGNHQDEQPSDTSNLSDSTSNESIVKKEGGSLNRGTVYYFYENPLNSGLPELRFIDTTKSHFHREDPYMRNNIFRSNRGNIGLLTEELEYSFRDQILFSYGKTSFDLYRQTYANTPFYQNVQPYVEMFYVMGKEKEQDFRVLYAQNLIRGWNVGAEFNVINSPGVYNRMFSNHNNIRVFTNYISKNKHYRAVAGYYRNRIDINENGGILTPADSLEFAPDNQKLLPVKYQQAENAWRENSFYLRQSYHLGVRRNDTVPNSGTSFGYLSHALEITRYRTMYRDKSLDPATYPAILRDSSQTFDSTFVGLIRNTFAWNIGDVTTFRSTQFLNVSIGFVQDHAEVSTDSVYRKTYNLLYPFAKLRLNYQNKYLFSSGITVTDDVRDLSANAQFYYVFNPQKNDDGGFAEINFSNLRPRPFQTNYIGNHYAWDTSFDHQKTLNIAVGARWKGFYLRGEMTTLQNYIYLSESHFAQTKEPFSIFKASLEKTFKLWILALDTRLVFQLRPTGPWFQLPTFATRNAFYFDFVLLGKTPMQVGVELYYNTSYKSRFYNPVLASFYGQGEVETGGFAYLDAFANLRVQRANLFIKMSNIGAQWMGYDYFMTYGYPTVPRSFSFGVFWRFYD